ncbi:MAG TPA: lipoprotein-releasing ABC transporter permease subunit [Pseudomonadales bacterium]
MNGALTLALGGRYAFSRRSTLSFISLVAVSGLALSVAVLVVVVSVINGFERELEERVLGVLPHVTVDGRSPLPVREQDRALLGSVRGVIGVAPIVQGVGLAAVSDRVAGVLITGIVPDAYRAVSDYARHVVGDVGLEAGAYQVILGAGVARELGAGVGDDVSLVLPAATVTPAGLFPRQKRFRVSGILRSQSEVDARAAYVHLDDARKLFRLGDRIHGYQLRLDDLFDADAVAGAAVNRLGRERVVARSWTRTHGNLYHAIGVQKSTMFVLLSFLVAVAAFNLVSTLVMVVNQRSGDIAILRTLGSGTGTLVGAFVLLGVLLGALGIVTGAAAGTAVAFGLPHLYAWVTQTFELDLMNQYFVSYLPVEVRFEDLTGIVLTALGLCVLSTFYPAWRAARVAPSQVLAHE